MFIDLDTFGAADPVLDLAMLLARFASMSLRHGVPVPSAEAAAQALTEEYFARVPADWRPRLEVNRACASLKVALELFRHQHPRWRELVPEWIMKAREIARTG